MAASSHPATAIHERDLGSVELWRRSLERSRRRRELSDAMRRSSGRRRRASVALSAAMATAPIAPGVAAASGADPGVGAGGATASELALASHVVLRVGSSGPLVAALQRRLNLVVARHHLAVDGIFGRQTRAAVVDFQRHHGLTASGMVDADTWALLFDAPVIEFGSAAAFEGGGAGPGGSAARGGGVAAARGRAPVVLGVSAAGTGGVSADRAGAGDEAPTRALDQSPRPEVTASRPSRAGTGGVTGPVSIVSPPSPRPRPVTYTLVGGIALPLPRQYLQNGSVDQGVDYAAPGGTPEYAMGDGIIVGEGISGFGPNAPILKITDGPLKGMEVYYGHAGPDIVRVGQRVHAGQQITEVGYGIVGISTGPHLEVGFYPPGRMGAGSRMLAVIDNALHARRAGTVSARSAKTIDPRRDALRPVGASGPSPLERAAAIPRPATGGLAAPPPSLYSARRLSIAGARVAVSMPSVDAGGGAARLARVEDGAPAARSRNGRGGESAVAHGAPDNAASRSAAPTSAARQAVRHSDPGGHIARRPRLSVREAIPEPPGGIRAPK